MHCEPDSALAERRVAMHRALLLKKNEAVNGLLFNYSTNAMKSQYDICLTDTVYWLYS